MSRTGSDGNDLIQVTELDIVAKKLPGGAYALSEVSHGKQEIGRNRLNVLIDIYWEFFSNHFSSNNQRGCDEIVRSIYDATRKTKDGRTCKSNGPVGGDIGGRFIFKNTAVPSDIGWVWRELDEKSSKDLINQILMSRIDIENDIIDSEELFDGIGYEVGSPDFNSDYAEGSRSGRPKYRRSRSASNMMFDAQDAFSQVMNFHDEELQEEFEPLPITSSCNSNEVLDALEMMNHELNNRKKRERTRSLLRRSNSFESVFDKKKLFKIAQDDLPSSSRQPSFIRNFTSTPAVSASSRNLKSRAVKYATKYAPKFVSNGFNFKKSGSVVTSHQGLDIVLLEDCKTLNTETTIVGNNRLKILLKLERRRFSVLSPDEQQKTADDLVTTITECWKGRVLMQKGISYKVLSREEARDAMYDLLLGKNNSRRASQNEAFDWTANVQMNSTTSTSSTTSLLKAPPLPAFLQKASREILSSREKNSSQMTTKERQAAAIDALKIRNKNRQLAKQKNNKEEEKS